MTANAQTTSRLAPVTADTALFTFYDIESLANVFTLCAYTPRPGAQVDDLEVFFLIDDQDIAARIDPNALYRHIIEYNPGLPPVRVNLWNLHDEKAQMQLAGLIGVSSAETVGDPYARSNYPAHLRPVCDTDDIVYDPTQHPFLAGYNSQNYDTTMLALYFSELFCKFDNHAESIRKVNAQIRSNRNPEDLADAQAKLRELQASTPTLGEVTAATMRAHNNRLFEEENIKYMPGVLGWEDPAARIRRNMINSGRHLDVARLNELQQKVALKRLLGMLGRQIKESEKLGHDSVITSVDELYELLGYNVSDCLGLSQLLRHNTYAGNFDLKANLLSQYSETVYNTDGTVRKDRLTIDSSSAKFVGRILSPFGSLKDIEAVSFNYPAKEVAEEQGIEQVNVLNESVRFFKREVVPGLFVSEDSDDFTPMPTEPAAAQLWQRQRAAWECFAPVVAYYRSIEGKNFNDSEEYQAVFNRDVHSLRTLPKAPNNVPYFNADASASSCFVTFSTGGIHGAEADLMTYQIDVLLHQRQQIMIETARTRFPEAVDFVAEAKRQHNLLTLPDGSTVDKRLVLLGSDPEKVKYRKPKKDDPDQCEQIVRAQTQVPEPADLLATQRSESQALNIVLPSGVVLEGKVVLANTTASKATYREEPARKKPELFIEKQDGSTKLHPKYVRTSAGPVIHEDFTSYYPNLLRNMRAFYNPDLGEDRYATIFFEKERLGQEMKTPGLDPAIKARLKTLREGTKLILNSASGAGDATHKTPIRMNNQIISMRILGQLFSWRIGQAQTLAGARIISTNTDGLYSVVGGANGFDEETNNAVLAEQQAAIGIEIEPELMFLVSKDSNNRLELAAPPQGASVSESRIISAGGGTLACHGGPTPTKALAHPAVIDWALARYLQTTAARGEQALSEKFDTELGAQIIAEAVDRNEPVKTLTLFQNMINASRGSITYPFAADPVAVRAEHATNTDVNDADTDSEESENDSVETIESEDTDSSLLVNPRPLQMNNRVFIVKPGTEGAVSLHSAGSWKVSAVSRAKREATGIHPEPDHVAVSILRHHGWALTNWEARAGNGTESLNLLPADQDVVVRKLNGIDPTWSMLVANDDLHVLDPRELDRIISALDLEVYAQMLAETFTKNWKNQLE